MSGAPDWLLADIGGTHARFALATAHDRPRDVAVLRCADHPDPLSAIRAYLATTTATPRAACLAVAGPVAGDHFRFTNSHWAFSRTALAMALGLDHLEVVNDFAALALALPSLGADDTVPLGAPREGIPRAPCLVLGPGTGLGVAVLVPAGDGWQPLAGEGGHAGFAPQDELEDALLALLRRRHGRVSNETLLSGAGLALLHQALGEIEDVPVETGDAAAVVDAAIVAREPRALGTVERFCAILGSVAGDLALVGGARGGVFIGGGIAPRLGVLLEQSTFRARFEDKGQQRDYVRAIPTRLIVAPAPTLLGARNALAAAAA